MIKAAVFDDEYIVLHGLQTMIDWSQYGIELVGTAADGLSALSLWKTYRPDIVFTDIRMPGIDGLQLVEKILSESPETICIVFSGFNEYEYVKKAIKLGVADYLEKPITVSMMKDTIPKIIEKIEQKKELSMLKSKWENSQRELLEKATLDLLLLGNEAEAKWRECFGDDEDRVVGITVIALSEYRYFISNAPSYRIVYVRNGSEQLFVVFHFDVQSDVLWKQLCFWAEQVGITVGCGRTYSHITDAPKSYKEALQALKYGRFMEENGWIHFEDISGDSPFSTDLPKQEEAVMFYIRTGDKEGLLRQLDGYIKQLKSKGLHPNIVEREVLKFVYFAIEAAKETGANIDEIWGKDYLPHVEIRQMNTREEMFQWLHSQMEMIMDWVMAFRQKTKHSAVEKACIYIKDNYNRDLTLQEVAEHVGMNPAYFSLLFKEEMGHSYIKYLTEIRMEQAKELLREGYKVTDVSEMVGYHSYKHFSEVFKKYVGMKPGQYKEIF
ncbi:response regulator [Saccharococcus caldoxylosilyticus]|uniref:response regulator n=1 Tax=Saccharococcus caldoxylosilyticus TaxID=81408 RepID=UPI0009C04C64|nr:response regulator [Parageobacillus caldoxylosilyticus]OQO97882.1 DNA-binding response regulator [Geobacillus sp. 44B]QXJ40388.1 HTH-type transcriptional regulator YesS [Parageobacillus caldoxylosilyticus]BDG35954.1 AraC family transcriptional regulator [Parageobacillus caldoxylosilyticus]BDG39736.1 AraC family transcriptional regulator [Parageobacillus caldoxylosilyticus]BDG43506.1 AraC family transcriptional regulator [Parageobacillus caldoxylosilyticus]